VRPHLPCRDYSSCRINTCRSWNHGDNVEGSIAKSLENAGLDYFDLYLIHWPQFIPYKDGKSLPRNEKGVIKTVDSPTINEIWAQMEKVLASGKVKAIGVSNFSIKTLEQLFTTAKTVPAVNQVELHPYLAQPKLLEYCKSKGITVTAYTPTGYATVRQDPLIVELAEKYKVSPAQIILAWHLAYGTTAVPKSSNVDRQKENINLPKLSAEDVKRVTGLDRNERLCNKPDENGLIMGWTLEQLGWEPYQPSSL